MRKRKGTVHYTDGGKYEGELTGGIKNGKGTYYALNGDKYEGEWRDDKADGKGTGIAKSIKLEIIIHLEFFCCDDK